MTYLTSNFVFVFTFQIHFRCGPNAKMYDSNIFIIEKRTNNNNNIIIDTWHNVIICTNYLQPHQWGKFVQPIV